MAQWYVKGLSTLTGVSVQALHHYDRIGLLKPSLKRSNGYRVYSEKDLMKLQSIIALKFFGFDLAQIKKLLSGNNEILDQFKMQAEFLEQKAELLVQASVALKRIIADCEIKKSVSWQTLIQTIEVYNMTQKLENKWVAQVLNQEELKQYAEFEADLKNRFTAEEHREWEQGWEFFLSAVRLNLKKDPKSEIGITLAKQMMELVNYLYGEKYATLQHTLWTEGFLKGKSGGAHGMSQEMIDWLGKATNHYYGQRVKAIIQSAQHDSSNAIKELNTLLKELYGNNQALKNEYIEMIMQKQEVPEHAKTWLAEHFKP